MTVILLGISKGTVHRFLFSNVSVASIHYQSSNNGDLVNNRKLGFNGIVNNSTVNSYS